MPPEPSVEGRHRNSSLLQEPRKKTLSSCNISPAPSTDKAPGSAGEGQMLKAQTHFHRTGQKVELELRGSKSTAGTQGQGKILPPYPKKVIFKLNSRRQSVISDKIFSSG